jgi:hypothetical protein
MNQACRHAVLAMIALLDVALGQQQGSAVGTVRLRVLDPNGGPVPTVTVAPVRWLLSAFVLDRPERTLTQRDLVEGAFLLTDVEVGSRTLLVTAPPLAPTRCEPVEIVAGKTIEIVVRMKRGCTLEGTLRDVRCDGIEGAHVTTCAPWECAGDTYISGAPPLQADLTRTSTITDRSGRFRIQGLASGEYALFVTHPQRALTVRAFSVAKQETIVIDPVVMLDGALLTGQVTYDGWGVAGVEVSATCTRDEPNVLVRVESMITRTDEFGRFQLPRAVTAGTWTLSAQPPRRKDATAPDSEFRGVSQIVRVRDSEQITPVELRLPGRPGGPVKAK